MNKVELILHIHSGFSAYQTGDVWLKKDFELPFVPNKEINTPFYCVSDIKQIHYDFDNNLYQIYLEDNEIYNAKLHDQECRDIEEIVSEYMEENEETDFPWINKYE